MNAASYNLFCVETKHYITPLSFAATRIPILARVFSRAFQNTLQLCINFDAA